MLVPLNKEKAAMLVLDQILRELNSIIMQTLPFVFVEKHACWSREWKPAIGSVLRKKPSLIDQSKLSIFSFIVLV